MVSFCIAISYATVWGPARPRGPQYVLTQPADHVSVFLPVVVRGNLRRRDPAADKFHNAWREHPASLRLPTSRSNEVPACCRFNKALSCTGIKPALR